MKSIQATALSPSPIFAGNSGTFTVCTQYFSKYIASGYDNSIVSVTIAPSTPVDDVIYTATVTINALKAGTTNVTITDKKGHSVQVAVTVVKHGSQTFSYTGDQQTFTVPAGITQVTVDAVGATGGAACDGTFTNVPGGLGFELKATGIAVTPGQSLYIYVGGSPVANANAICNPKLVNPTFTAAGFNGGGTGHASGPLASGGGGGASDVRTSSGDLSTRVIVAGGGGGNGFFTSPVVAGGAGGYPNGVAGAYAFLGTDPTSAIAGQGGSQNSSGGEGGQVPPPQGIVFVSCPGSQGTLGIGGSTNTGDQCTSGAGGGGYYGGGSGATFDYSNPPANPAGWSGGGGGSSFVENGATVVTQQVATSGQCDANNDGCITISW